ncbi:hypothetical protein BWQ96_04165 [Gracilariopsis chorda]|uniref:Retrovirus-related Pol polyprotein from transposon TNT 1-94-like beta-barrel domain-containing protein n=1 Tax=Gracilariopsis chorda TaxID=448386 RepID=A0A2V3IVF1_9FLOR|nr:hypothetical protein BWQ96_04165 [Gracilariopsis chorda]|eukprot:PXF46065.1 hypothetical protein BWQ96_04165 [Gracilariopsis chorda]
MRNWWHNPESKNYKGEKKRRVKDHDNTGNGNDNEHDSVTCSSVVLLGNEKTNEDEEIDLQFEAQHTKHNLMLRETGYVTNHRVRSARETRWYLDFSASTHMTNNLHFFVHGQQSSDNKHVFVGDGSTIKLNGQGNAECWAIDGQGKLVKIQLCDVLYVSQLICNLLSVSAIRRRMFMKLFLSDDDEDIIGVVLKQKSVNIPVMGKELSEWLYEMELKLHDHLDKSLNTCMPEHFTVTWHRCLGDARADYIRSTLRLVSGVRPEPIQDIGNCEPFAEGKARRKPYRPNTASSQDMEVLDFVQLDVMGPINIKSLSKSKYIVT